MKKRRKLHCSFCPVAQGTDAFPFIFFAILNSRRYSFVLFAFPFLILVFEIDHICTVSAWLHQGK
jgi:hypothetical protein